MKPGNKIAFSNRKGKIKKGLLTLFGIAFCSALPNHLLALGLGEISSSSKLGEPLNASIALNNVGDLSDEELSIDLGDVEQYARIGVDRPHYHQQLRFNLERLEQDQPRIKVSTKDPMDEPFLDFVIQVRWPKGMLAKEFTVLLDPPLASRNEPTNTTATRQPHYKLSCAYNWKNGSAKISSQRSERRSLSLDGKSCQQLNQATTQAPELCE